jgi:hypothetical protein
VEIFYFDIAVSSEKKGVQIAKGTNSSFSGLVRVLTTEDTGGLRKIFDVAIKLLPVTQSLIELRSLSFHRRNKFSYHALDGICQVFLI